MNGESLDLPNSLEARKILIVDDDRINLRILQNILKKAGYATVEASSGEAALELYASFQPNLVLLDVIMPGIDGFTTCRELRRRYGEETAPVIFITAKSESDDVVEGLSAGGVDYLPKPFREKEALARIRTHLEMRMLMAKQKLLVDQLSKANYAKNRFLGMAAHDLRGPLASIKGLAEFLSEGACGNLNDSQADLVNSIHDASQSMLVLVNELLDVATIESGELKVSLEKRDLAELMEKSISLFNIEAAKKGSHVEFTDKPAHVVLEFDWSKLKQVIDNLLSNALKYSPPKSTIRARLRLEDTQAVFSIQDQGPGIPDNERDKLFKDFGRLSVRPTGDEKSTGLGLAICRKIVEAHKGSISANNMPEGGCAFQVILPLHS